MQTRIIASMKKQKFKIIVFFLVMAGIIAILLFTGLSNMNLNAVRTLGSLNQVDNHPLYTMTYYGGYGFENFLKTGAKNDNETIGNIMKNINGVRIPAPEITDGVMCSAFSASDESNNRIMGRNADWHDRPSLLLFTHPPKGYASMSMVDIAFLGYNPKNTPMDWSNRMNLLAAPYMPFDGMNECGLAVATLSVPDADGGNDPRKITINNTVAMRLILDYARNVDEAVSILQNYNIYFSLESPAHFFVSDASGGSAAIEFINGKVVSTKSSRPWQVLTNFIVNGNTNDVSEQICDRYHKLYESLGNKNGKISQKEAMDILKGVSVRKTVWSEVFNLTTGEINIAMDRKYDEVMTFKLEKQGSDRIVFKPVSMPKKRSPKDTRKFEDTIADNENVLIELKHISCTGMKKDVLPYVDLLKQLDKYISDIKYSSDSRINVAIYTDEEKLRKCIGTSAGQLPQVSKGNDGKINILLPQTSQPGDIDKSLYGKICEEFVKILTR